MQKHCLKYCKIKELFICIVKNIFLHLNIKQMAYLNNLFCYSRTNQSSSTIPKLKSPMNFGKSWDSMGICELAIISIINSISKIDNLAYNPTKYNFNDFNYLIRVFSTGENQNYLYDDTVFDISMRQIT